MPNPDNVFKQEPNQEPNQEPQVLTSATPDAVQPQSGDIFNDQLKDIKAEDGRQKYDTVPKALDALAHSQTFIPQLQTQVTQQEAEIIKLREELAKRNGVQEVVDQLTNHQQQGQEGNPSETSLGEQDVERLVVAALDKRNQQQVATTNEDKVNQTLVNAFGDQAVSVVQAKAKELNTTPEALGDLAKSSPDMVLALFQQKSSQASFTNSSQRSGFNVPEQEPLKAPDKSVLSGSTSKEQTEFMRKVKEDVYRRLGVTQ